ncbi:MAG TPA: polymer-forming cytoskeletal protein [Thermoanaerobacterales bacterium]|nr:polymer-forming cytoskeletal protein [Thermoanaerobacterales bacterium]
MFGRKQQPQTNEKDIGKVEIVIGKDTQIKGTIKGQGTIRIDGEFEGEIDIEGNVIVSEAGNVNANINAKDVTAAGVIVGNIIADGKLEIIKEGKVSGDIKVAALVINDGAIFDGKSEMVHKGEFNTTQDDIEEEVDF